MSQCENLGGGQKLSNHSQPFLGESSQNLRGMYMSHCGFKISFQLLMSCSVAEICSVKFQSRSPKAVSAPARGVNARGVRTKVFK